MQTKVSSKVYVATPPMFHRSSKQVNRQKIILMEKDISSTKPKIKLSDKMMEYIFCFLSFKENLLARSVSLLWRELLRNSIKFYQSVLRLDGKSKNRMLSRKDLNFILREVSDSENGSIARKICLKNAEIDYLTLMILERFPKLKSLTLSTIAV